MSIPIQNSIKELSTDIDVWLTDIWGVMHNGATPHQDAVEACKNFRDTGGTVILLSNAPRPAASVAEGLDRIGVPRSAWDAIVSSGDAARALIAQLGTTPVFHIGPERDLPLFDRLQVRLVGADQADAIVCSGLFDDTVETPADYLSQLIELSKRGLNMVCANPDIRVERGGNIIYCADAIAAEYEKLGGKVVYAGKPHAPIYGLARKIVEDIRNEPLQVERTLAIGDGVYTDIKGAAGAGVRPIGQKPVDPVRWLRPNPIINM